MIHYTYIFIYVYKPTYIHAIAFLLNLTKYFLSSSYMKGKTTKKRSDL